jgi:hypothetical protein
LGTRSFSYIALPVALSLNGRANTYATTVSANLGVSGILPVQTGSKKLTANAEANIGLKDSYTGVFFGVAYPIE